MPKPIRPIRIEGNLAYVPLTKGYEAVIDVEDAHLVEGFNWWASVGVRTVYARRTNFSDIPRQSEKMHRVIMACPEDKVVDHIDGDGLNNRRSNMRIVSRAENTCNRRITLKSTSGFKGVSADKGSWRAQISVGGKQRRLGHFATPEEAHAAYCAASAALHGEFGRNQ
jgi:hypothetical protein